MRMRIPVTALTAISFMLAACASAKHEPPNPPKDVPLPTFLINGNALVCVSPKEQYSESPYLCHRIGPLTVGMPYKPTSAPSKEIPLEGGIVASVFPIVCDQNENAYWVISHDDARIWSIQLAGHANLPDLTLAGIALGDSADTVSKLLGPRFSEYAVPEINGVARDYAPFEISIEFVDGKVYSMKVWGKPLAGH